MSYVFAFAFASVLLLVWFYLTCDQAFFFRRSAKEKQRETRRSVGGQSRFSQARKKYILSRSSEKITPDRRLGFILLLCLVCVFSFIFI